MVCSLDRHLIVAILYVDNVENVREGRWKLHLKSIEGFGRESDVAMILEE